MILPGGRTPVTYNAVQPVLSGARGSGEEGVLMAENTDSAVQRGLAAVARKNAAENGVSPFLCPLTAEEGREIAANVTGFFSVLTQREAAEHRGPLGVEQFRGGGTPRLGGAAYAARVLGRTA